MTTAHEDSGKLGYSGLQTPHMRGVGDTHIRSVASRPDRAVVKAAGEFRTQRYWDHQYDNPPELNGLPVTREELTLLRRHVIPAGASTALDIGCGWGILAAQLAHMKLGVTGYDWSPPAIFAARELINPSIRLAFEQHDLVDGPPLNVAPGSVDLVVCRLTLPFLDRHRLLPQVRRWLTPDTGTLYAVVATGPTHSSHALPLSERDIDELQHGWKDSRRWRLGTDGTYAALALRGAEGP
ncbi:class I SAM-dependent methyltransferase [Streptomyces sp. NPDC002073]